jgi:hypothetical protein
MGRVWESLAVMPLFEAKGWKDRGGLLLRLGLIAVLVTEEIDRLQAGLPAG